MLTITPHIPKHIKILLYCSFKCVDLTLYGLLVSVIRPISIKAVPGWFVGELWSAIITGFSTAEYELVENSYITLKGLCTLFQLSSEKIRERDIFKLF